MFFTYQKKKKSSRPLLSHKESEQFNIRYVTETHDLFLSSCDWDKTLSLKDEFDVLSGLALVWFDSF